MRPATAALLALLALLAALAGCSAYRAYEKCGWAGCPGDPEISRAVRAQLRQHTELEPPNLVYVQTSDAVVFLTGEVATDLQRTTAAEVAQQVPGVRAVVNSIALSYPGR